MRPRPLPPHLTTRPFHIAEAFAAGATSTRMRASDLLRPFPGVRVLHAGAGDDLVSRCRALLPRLHPEHFFSHATAAGLWGVPLPFDAAAAELDVSCPPPHREPRLRGVRGHRIDVDDADLTTLDGLPLARPAEAWAQLGAALSLDDLVVAADHLIGPAGLADAAELAAAVERLRRRGAVQLREALAQSRPGSESPRETRTRLVIVRSGLPEPELNWTLRTASGRFVARLDMAYPEYRVGIEYDGRHHAEGAQFARDADRWVDIQTEGWLLVRVLAHHFDRPERDIALRTRRALRSRGWTPTP